MKNHLKLVDFDPNDEHGMLGVIMVFRVNYIQLVVAQLFHVSFIFTFISAIFSNNKLTISLRFVPNVFTCISKG